MEIYDYRNTNIDIDEEIELLTAKQISKIVTAIDTIKKDSEEEKILHWNTWFDNAILPILKDFAELTGSVLEISRDRRVIETTFRNAGSIDITENCLFMRSAIATAVYISISEKNGEAVFLLSYDVDNFI